MLKNLYMRYPGGTAKALTFSYDDGVRQDIRLAAVFAQYGLKATFNLCSSLLASEEGGRFLTAEEAKALYDNPLFEVASHTVNHPSLPLGDPAAVYAEVVLDRKALEELMGTRVHGMGYPFGTYNEQVVDIMRHAGIHYARTVKSSYSFDLPTDWLVLHPTCHHNDPRLFELADKFIALEPDKQHESHQEAKLFYVWGHSYEFDTNNNWHRIEEFAEKMAGREDIWYATNEEIYDYQRAYTRLRYDAAATMMYNPTCYDIWYCDNGRCSVIRSGETVKLL